MYAPALPRASQFHRHGMGFAKVMEEVVQSCLDNPHEPESVSETRLYSDWDCRGEIS